jgi:RHS repeat-associated protein
VVAEYRYDALGRRIEKVVNGVSIRYLYHNEDVVLELDGGNNVTALYIPGPGIDEPLAMFREGRTVVYHADGLGSITTLTDLNGNPVRTYTYDSFGRIVAQTGTVTNPYTYTGRELDPESGLYYYRARYYDPQSGRFLNEDPLNMSVILRFLQVARNITRSPGGAESIVQQLLSIPHDSNLFLYAINNPVNLTDPLGLQVRNIFDAIGQLSNAICRGIRNLNCDAGKICSVIVLGAAATVAVTGAIVLVVAALPGAVVEAPVVVALAFATPAAVSTTIVAAEDVFR